MTDSEREIEDAKRERSRRWVREYENAVKNIMSGWGVDEHGRPFLINMAVGGKMRKSRKKKQPSKAKQKVDKPNLTSVG